MTSISSSDSEHIAAVDLGSNSFHMVVARVVDGEPVLVDRHREMVRLAAGLHADGQLDAAAQERALACLERFGQVLRGMSSAAVRAVGTNTMRVVRKDKKFRAAAEAALGQRIEVIAGREEARLIYLGVAHSLADDGQDRLVMDIGGGSTELIFGRRFEALRMESLFMGCVSFARRFFDGGKITRKAMRKAQLAASQELQPVAGALAKSGWEDAVGASGTIRTAEAVIAAQGWGDGRITGDHLERLAGLLVDAGHADALDLPGLKPERRDVFASGIAILQALVADLGIDVLHTSRGALREGVLYDLLGRRSHEDVRARSVQQLITRYQVDTEQADRVEETALQILQDSGLADALRLPEAQLLLRWGAQLHEIGMAVAYRHYHRHGAYLLGHSDLPGFSADEQALLAFLVSAHRGKYPDPDQEGITARDAEDALRLSLVLRLAVLLNRGHLGLETPGWRLRWKDNVLEIRCPSAWLDDHTLTRMDLEGQVEQLAKAPVRVVLRER